MIEFDGFKQACEAWLREVVSNILLRGVPLKKDIDVFFHSSGYSVDEVLLIDAEQPSIIYHDELFSLPHYQKLVEIVASSPALTSVLFVDNEGNIPLEAKNQQEVLEWYFTRFLSEYLRMNGGSYLMHFSPHYFNYLYERFERYIVSKKSFDGVWSVHLRNMTSEIDTIRIDRNLFLRVATHEEKVDALRKDANLFFKAPQMEISPGLQIAPEIPRIFLDVHQPLDRLIERKLPPSPQQSMSIAQMVLLTLRLLKPNPVGIESYHWSIPEQPFALFNRGLFHSMVLHPFAYQGEPYMLTQEDADVLPRLWRRTKKAYTEPELQTAISRFEDSYLRTKPEDKLIDYWIALESLFFSLINKEYIGSMGDTVASTVAFYLGNTQSERNSIYTFIISSHVARGYFVHGHRGKPVKDIDLVVKKTEKYLRMALRKRVEEG